MNPYPAHTPKPWKVALSPTIREIQIQSSSGDLIAELPYGDKVPQHANALLLVGAPELLEALVDCQLQLRTLLQAYQCAKAELGQFNGLPDVDPSLLPLSQSTEESIYGAKLALTKVGYHS